MTKRHFLNIRIILRRRDDIRFSKCAFGVDETLGGKTRFSKRCVLVRQDAVLQSTFPVMSPEIIFVSARWRGSLFLKYVFGVDEMSTRRHSIFKCSLGVDKALGGKCCFSRMRVLRGRDAPYVTLFGDELGREKEFSISEFSGLMLGNHTEIRPYILGRLRIMSMARCGGPRFLRKYQ